jgi:hypothetical protein
VIRALIRKCWEAKQARANHIEAWGTGTATREFLYVEDAAEAIVLATQKYEKPVPVNLGSGEEISIRDLLEQIRSLVGYEGLIRWDASKPDGQPRRCLDTTRALAEFGWRARTLLRDGLRNTIRCRKQLKTRDESVKLHQSFLAGWCPLSLFFFSCCGLHVKLGWLPIRRIWFPNRGAGSTRGRYSAKDCCSWWADVLLCTQKRF